MLVTKKEQSKGSLIMFTFVCDFLFELTNKNFKLLILYFYDIKISHSPSLLIYFCYHPFDGLRNISSDFLIDIPHRIWKYKPFFITNGRPQECVASDYEHKEIV